MLWILLVIITFVGVLGGLFFLLGKKHITIDRQLKRNLKIAEDEGVTSANLEPMKMSTDPDVRKLLGLEGIKGTGLGLSDDWALQVISQVGNYGEIFERTLGRDSPIKMERYLNEIWSRGGLHYGPSID